MLQKILIYGVVAGLIVGLPLFGMTTAMNGHPPAPNGVLLGYLIRLIALSTVFVAIKRHRDTPPGRGRQVPARAGSAAGDQRRCRHVLCSGLGGGAGEIHCRHAAVQGGPRQPALPPADDVR